MSRMDIIRKRLESRLSPLQIRILDESARHSGHSGVTAGGDSHFHLEVISHQFEGLSRVARHRLIYEALGNVFEEGLHALRIDAKTPDE